LLFHWGRQDSLVRFLRLQNHSWGHSARNPEAAATRGEGRKLRTASLRGRQCEQAAGVVAWVRGGVDVPGERRRPAERRGVAELAL